jgi:hypothetical protein
MQPETPHFSNQELFRTPNQPASQISVISSSGRRRPRSNAMKLNNMFVSTLSLDKIRHAYPALVTWATLLVANKVNEEANNMIARETGLHLRAQAKEGGRGKSEESKVSWDKVNSFSLSSVRGIANEHAPMMSFLLNSYTTKERGRVNTNVGEVTAVRIYRPEPVVS